MQFIGLYNYYYLFIPFYAQIAEPLRWFLASTGHLNMVSHLISVASHSDQTYFATNLNFSLIHKVATDASNHAIGGILSQVQDG